MNTLRRYLLVSLGIVLASSLPSQSPAPQHLLRMAFRTGESQFFRKTLSIRSGPVDVPTMSATVELTIESKVGEVRETVAGVQQSVRHMTYKATGPGGRRDEYDSQSGGNDATISSLLARMIAGATTMKVDQLGKISDLQVPDELGLMSSRIMLLVAAIPLPDAPVAIGKTWEATAKMPIPEAADQDALLVSKLTGVEKGRAVIETEVRVDPDKVRMQRGVKIGKYIDTTTLDLATGRIIAGSAEIQWSSTDPLGTPMEHRVNIKVETIDPPPANEADKQGELAPGRGKG
jgi:hypothetical protein